jgi:hypothetical protein
MGRKRMIRKGKGKVRCPYSPTGEHVWITERSCIGGRSDIEHCIYCGDSREVGDLYTRRELEEQMREFEEKMKKEAKLKEAKKRKKMTR